MTADEPPVGASGDRSVSCPAVSADRSTAAAPFDRLYGLEITELTDQRVRGRVAVADHHKQPAGLVHGGVYASIGEALGRAGTAVALSDADADAVGISTQTSFMRPITAGVIEAVARPRHRGRTTWVWEVEIRDAAQRVCVLTRVTISVVPRSR